MKYKVVVVSFLSNHFEEVKIIDAEITTLNEIFKHPECVALKEKMKNELRKHSLDTRIVTFASVY